METTTRKNDTIFVSAIRRTLSSHLPENLIHRVLMCIKTNRPDAETIEVKDLRGLLSDDIRIEKVNRVIMTLKIHRDE